MYEYYYANANCTPPPSRQLYRFIVQLDQQENILKIIQILGVETMSLQAH